MAIQLKYRLEYLLNEHNRPRLAKQEQPVSWRDVEALTGIPYSTLNRIKGKRIGEGGNDEEIIALAKFFGVTIDEMYWKYPTAEEAVERMNVV